MDKALSLAERVRTRRGPKHRSAIWVVLALVAGVLAVTAGTANAGDGSDGESALGVHPEQVDLGGQPNDCDAVIDGRLPSAATNELRIENPQDGETYQDEDGVSFTLTLRNDKELDWVLNGPAVVFDVIIKGGKKSNHYDYDGPEGPGGAVEDNLLHGPSKGKGSFSISHTSFCYEDVVPASGTVFVDDNQNGVQDGVEGGDPLRVITAYDGMSAVASATSDTNGDYTLLLEPGSSYTICEEASDDFVQTAPDPKNALCNAPVSETGGYTVTQIAAPVADLNFGNAPVICGQILIEDEGIELNGTFTLFAQGNAESGCNNKIGQLFESVDEEGTRQLNLPLTGSGEVAGIGVITKTFASPDDFVPLKYSQGPTDSTFEVLPWCQLRTKAGNDGTQFDQYLPGGLYPSLGVNNPVIDPDSEDDSVSCKVAEDENAEGTQTTVVLIQDDPFWR